MLDERENLVEILSFCFMPNHIHLLLKQIENNGITKFMTKVGTGYAGYFNRKYQRKGYVFQNRFRDVHIKSDDQLKTIFNYIHCNPVSLIEPGWKELGVKNIKKVKHFLENKYRWSSYFDFINKKNFPSVTKRDFMLEFMGGSQGCKESVKSWIDYKKDLNQFPEILLD